MSDRPKTPHEPFGWGCPREPGSNPAECVLCYGMLVRIVAPVFMGRVA